MLVIVVEFSIKQCPQYDINPTYRSYLDKTKRDNVRQYETKKIQNSTIQHKTKTKVSRYFVSLSLTLTHSATVGQKCSVTLPVCTDHDRIYDPQIYVCERETCPDLK